VISGLPGSGKTTLGRRLAPALDLPLIDKDDILNRLFESKGVGNAAWRRTLSRESDVTLQQEATKSNRTWRISFARFGAHWASSRDKDRVATRVYRRAETIFTTNCQHSRIMLAVEGIDGVGARLHARGAELVGKVAHCEDKYPLTASVSQIGWKLGVGSWEFAIERCLLKRSSPRNQPMLTNR
jgi:hypothetical protein